MSKGFYGESDAAIAKHMGAIMVASFVGLFVLAAWL